MKGKRTFFKYMFYNTTLRIFLFITMMNAAMIGVSYALHHTGFAILLAGVYAVFCCAYLLINLSRWLRYKSFFKEDYNPTQK